MSKESYARGFCKAAEDAGVDPTALAKYAADKLEYAAPMSQYQTAFRMQKSVPTAEQLAPPSGSGVNQMSPAIAHNIGAKRRWKMLQKLMPRSGAIVPGDTKPYTGNVLSLR